MKLPLEIRCSPYAVHEDERWFYAWRAATPSAPESGVSIRTTRRQGSVEFEATMTPLTVLTFGSERTPAVA
jgi:hypothetical protein